jgi:hypothetical protein
LGADHLESGGGVVTEATRRTLLGFVDAIATAVRAIAYSGDVQPRVLLYVRKGHQPSVKVTVEPHRYENPRTTIVVEEDEAPPLEKYFKRGGDGDAD